MYWIQIVCTQFADKYEETNTKFINSFHFRNIFQLHNQQSMTASKLFWKKITSVRFSNNFHVLRRQSFN